MIRFAADRPQGDPLRLWCRTQKPPPGARQTHPLLDRIPVLQVYRGRDTARSVGGGPDALAVRVIEPTYRPAGLRERRRWDLVLWPRRARGDRLESAGGDW